MNTQQPVNRFRTSAPQQPRPKVTQPAPQREYKRSRKSTYSSSSGWGKTRQFMRDRPYLESIYWFFVKAFLWIFFGSLAYVIALKYVPVYVTPLMVSRWIDSTGDDTHVHKKWRSYDDISKEVALAVVSSEDQAFPTHWGFDFDEIQDAIKENQTRKRARGASTISQQVAKNVFLWNGHSYIRKGLEVYFTMLIELIWGKKRILEVYLNVAETGPMTFGVEAASERYYGHPAKELSRNEAARIAAVLPNPIQFSVANPSNYTLRRTRQIARQMRYLGGQKYIQNL
ncbi:monofunctional biosynthetic peptidoglycan transglycosylase [Spirosoma harenae]